MSRPLYDRTYVVFDEKVRSSNLLVVQRGPKFGFRFNVAVAALAEGRYPEMNVDFTLDDFIRFGHPPVNQKTLVVSWLAKNLFQERKKMLRNPEAYTQLCHELLFIIKAADQEMVCLNPKCNDRKYTARIGDHCFCGQELVLYRTNIRIAIERAKELGVL